MVANTFDHIKYISALFILVLILFFLDLFLGSVTIPFQKVFEIITGIDNSQNKTWTYIILKIRFPKAITAILVGSALSVAGLQMQTLFRNPLAGPSILGITSGASLGVAFVLLLSGSITTFNILRNTETSGQWMITLASIIGSAFVLVIILLISYKIRDNITLLIAGMMIGSITISFVSIWQYFSDPEKIKEYLSWTFGSLGSVTSDHLHIFILTTIIGITATFLLSKPLNALLLGDRYAKSLGISIQKYRILIILITSILAGSATAFCGPIAFIGISVPHLARAAFNTTNHQILIPACILLGSSLMLFCDIIAQLPGYATTLPVNSVTTLIGSPVVLWMVVKNNNLRNSF